MTSPRAQMLTFFLAAVAIYGSVHAYVWWRTVRQLALRGPAAGALAAALALLVILPFLGRLLGDGSPLLGAVELVAFAWMGAVFYLFALNATADLWNAAARLVRLATPVPLLSGPRLFGAIAAATLAIVAYAAAEASSIRLARLEVATPRLAPGAPPVRVVQISDVHLGMLLGERRLRRILDRVREARPDLLVCTGDLLDAVGDRLEPLAAALREVPAPLGKLAVTGNHEYYSGIPGALAFLRSAGFRVLRDEAVVIPGRLNVLGAEYRAPRGLPGSPPRLRPLAEVAAEADPALFTVLLKHLPTGLEEEAAPLGIGLQLSGHTHDGQLFPFRWLVRLAFPRLAGPYRAGGSTLYVSRGTGTWGPPLRFLAPPEVTLIEIVPGSAHSQGHPGRSEASGRTPA